jgi:hypothetical protein
MESGGDDLAADRVRERDVAPDVESEPAVGPLGGRGAPRVDRVEPRPIVDAAQDVVEEDRMRLPGVAAPEDDQTGLLNLAI